MKNLLFLVIVSFFFVACNKEEHQVEESFSQPQKLFDITSGKFKDLPAHFWGVTPLSEQKMGFMLKTVSGNTVPLGTLQYGVTTYFYQWSSFNVGDTLWANIDNPDDPYRTKRDYSVVIQITEDQ